mgnify:CR=1 FL=1
MSFLRAKLRATDRNVYYNNRLSDFANVPMYYNNVRVRGDETIHGYLDVCGNVTVRSNLTVLGNIYATSFYATGNYYLNNFILVPYGTIIQSAAVTIPGGWLVCDGTLLNKYTYSNLFDAIGYTYGGVDNSFNLPDLRGRTTVGAGAGSGLTNRTLAATGGEETHTLTITEMPSHDHGSNASGGQGHYGLMYNSGYNTMNAAVNDGNEPDLYVPPGALDIYNTGGGGAHNNMQPFLVLQYLIKY